MSAAGVAVLPLRVRRGIPCWRCREALWLSGLATDDPLAACFWRLIMRIWCNAQFPPAAEALLRQGVADHELVFSTALEASNLAAGQADPQLGTAEVVFGQVDPGAIIAHPGIKWVHITTAGYERYDRADLRAALQARGGMMTNSSTVYAEPCAQHALAMMLALARQLPLSWLNQRSERGWPYLSIRGISQNLVGQTTLFLGFGAIAKRLAELLGPFHMRLAAVRRRVRGDEPIATYDEAHLDRLLAEADHVVNVLPGGTSTQRFMTAERFGKMKPSAVFYNIGRGTTVDQDALMAVLRSGRIAGAYLDVMDPEPLPAEHPLWETPNCYITSHTAGGQREEQIRIVRHFLSNLEAYATGGTMKDRIV